MNDSPPAEFTAAAHAPSAASAFALRALPAPDPAIALWLCDLERDPATVEVFVACLSPEERARAARFGTALLRNRWIVGRATLRLLLGSATGVDPADVRIARGVRGRPELVGPRRLDFNVSHTRDIALIGVGHALPPAARIGVDLERADRRVNAEGLGRKFLTTNERTALAPLDADVRRQSFLRLWTCKEAMSKATGDALSAPLRHLDVKLAPKLALRAGPPPYTPADWWLIAADAGDELIATVAVWRAS
ncbi:MAG: 4'-phosphopantetheinyl transferase superfamily protein [Casimicrobiaceae bacterium]